MNQILMALKNGTATPDLNIIGAVTGISTPMERETNFDWQLIVHYQISGKVEVDSVQF
jgi:hypothetical protein